MVSVAVSEHWPVAVKGITRVGCIPCVDGVGGDTAGGVGRLGWAVEGSSIQPGNGRVDACMVGHAVPHHARARTYSLCSTAASCGEGSFKSSRSAASACDRDVLSSPEFGGDIFAS